jgi:alkylhydroperoxidase family enzyme
LKNRLNVTLKTESSRFHIHDELTAPDESAPILRSIQAAGGAVSKFVGVLAGAPAVLRAYTRMRSELRSGVLPQDTRERIALAVAEHRDDTYSIAQHAKSARHAGLGLDEVSKARSFDSGDPKEAALLTYLKATLEANGRPPQHLNEGAMEIGWTEEEILEAVAHLALNEFQSLIAGAAALPKDQATPRVLPNAA